MIYSVINQVQQKAVSQACRVLAVSRSGYYAAQRRADKSVICVASVQVKAAFVANQRCYGSRRIVDELKSQRIVIGRYKVRRLMREAGLKPVWKKKFVNTTDSRHDLPVAENLLNRQFNPPKSNQAWTSDITYIRTKTGWLYLAAVMDLHSRKIIGWAMSPTMPAALVCQALQMAVGQRQPSVGLMLHSDRGSQYASAEYQALLKQHGIICSMSRKGNCWDNAVMERFFLNLKMERVWQREYANQMEACKDVTEYIVGFYNCTRRHSALGNLAPIVYEKQFAAKQPISVYENT
jgi:transposase InsO family protein